VEERKVVDREIKFGLERERGEKEEKLQQK